MVIAGIIAGLIVIALILSVIIEKIFQRRNPAGMENGKKKIVVSEQGADVNSGSLGGGSAFKGFGQETMDTVCISQELLQEQTYSVRFKHIRLTDCDTGQVWESAFTKEIFIGRNAHPEGRTSMVIVCTGISSLHCSIYVDGTKMMLLDCSSTNGTFLNGESIRTSKQVKTGDILGLGIKKFRVEFT